jgi:quercetin dioxygenase-like cupin family protein
VRRERDVAVDDDRRTLVVVRQIALQRDPPPASDLLDVLDDGRLGVLDFGSSLELPSMPSTFGRLIGALLGDDPAPRVRTIPHESGEELHADSGMSAWLLYTESREHRSELFELRFDAGVESRSEPHLPGVAELIVCLSGRLRVGPAGEEAELGRGDAVWFAADVAHSYVAPQGARALCWMLYPPGALR